MKSALVFARLSLLMSSADAPFSQIILLFGSRLLSMKSFACFCVLLFSAGLGAAQSPTLKGHIAGESVQRFLELSPTLRSKVDVCRKNPDAIRLQGGDADECVDLLNAVDRGGRDLIEEGRFTFLLGNHRTLDFVGYVEFSGGKVTMLGVNFDGTWGDLYPDLFKKFGKPTTTDAIELQNGYGARFSFPKDTWVKPGYVVRAHEDMVTFGQIRFVEVEMIVASRMREIEKEEQTQENRLD